MDSHELISNDPEPAKFTTHAVQDPLCPGCKVRLLVSEKAVQALVDGIARLSIPAVQGQNGRPGDFQFLVPDDADRHIRRFRVQILLASALKAQLRWFRVHGTSQRCLVCFYEQQAAWALLKGNTKREMLMYERASIYRTFHRSALYASVLPLAVPATPAQVPS